MLFMIAVTGGRKDLDYQETVICGICGHYGRYQVFMTYSQLVLFFIPVFRWNRQYYVQMSCCGSIYQLDPEVGAAIASGESVGIREQDLTLLQRGGQQQAWGGGQQGSRDGGQQNAADSEKAAGERKRCPFCGYETTEDFEFCPKCGTKLEK